MIYCITQPIEEYSREHDTGLFRTGIGTIVNEKPALFSLISIMSPVLYQWEAGSPMPMDERLVRLSDHIEILYLESLSFNVGGLTLTNWLYMLDSPVSLYMNLCQFSLDSFPLFRYYNRSQLDMIMRARCRSWLLSRHMHLPTHETSMTVFSAEDEKEVMINAYGKYHRP